jgi:hypothetical protein
MTIANMTRVRGEISARILQGTLPRPVKRAFALVGAEAVEPLFPRLAIAYPILKCRSNGIKPGGEG